MRCELWIIWLTTLSRTPGLHIIHTHPFHRHHSLLLRTACHPYHVSHPFLGLAACLFCLSKLESEKSVKKHFCQCGRNFLAIISRCKISNCYLSSRVLRATHDNCWARFCSNIAPPLSEPHCRNCGNRNKRGKLLLGVSTHNRISVSSFFDFKGWFCDITAAALLHAHIFNFCSGLEELLSFWTRENRPK